MNVIKKGNSRWRPSSIVAATLLAALTVMSCTQAMTTQPAGPISESVGDVTDDGMPESTDNCIEVANPPDVFLGIPCATANDCVQDPENSPPRTLANGEAVPTAENPWFGDVGPVPVGVYCVDSDGNGIRDACAVQANNDRDPLGDACDDDDDNDLVTDSDGQDNCPFMENTSQENADGAIDGGDACDLDDDNDGVLDGADNCPLVANAGQDNLDGDPEGDVCDGDRDGDGMLDANNGDNCPDVANPDQTNTDGDFEGDACDDDDDNDRVLDPDDNCPLTGNVDQIDTDADGAGDACDEDDDNDGVLDGADNCPLVANVNQRNNDGDAQGDLCDPDDDNDGVCDPGQVAVGCADSDNCRAYANADQADADNDGLGDVCDFDCDGDGANDVRTLPNPCGNVDGDGDGFTRNQGDCNEGHGLVYPGAPEPCNNVDDDCNGVVDNNVTNCNPGQACLDGVCTTPECAADADCDPGEECRSGRCWNLCTGVVCNNPPADTCDGNATIVYDQQGSCFAGVCSYDSIRTECDPGFECRAGVCVDLCLGVVCEDPPPDTCDGTVAVLYGPVGDCFAGVCSYNPFMMVDCAPGTCAAGRCIPPEDCRVVGDEDGDGMADCDDPDCRGFPGCPLPCAVDTDCPVGQYCAGGSCADYVDNKGATTAVCMSGADGGNAPDGQADDWDWDSDCFCAVGPCLGSEDPRCVGSMGGDCQESLQSVHPGAAEVCNGRDDDCDGMPDDGLVGCNVCGP